MKEIRQGYRLGLYRLNRTGPFRIAVNLSLDGSYRTRHEDPTVKGERARLAGLHGQTIRYRRTVRFAVHDGYTRMPPVLGIRSRFSNTSCSFEATGTDTGGSAARRLHLQGDSPTEGLANLYWGGFFRETERIRRSIRTMAVRAARPVAQ